MSAAHRNNKRLARLRRAGVPIDGNYRIPEYRLVAMEDQSLCNEIVRRSDYDPFFNVFYVPQAGQSQLLKYAEAVV